MDHNIKQSRILAYNRQNGRCFYCGNPMWEKAIEPLTEALERFAEPRLEKDFSTAQNLLESFQCTAEHLVPQSTGGSDDPDNIFAACMLCNSTRMSMNTDEFRAKVRATFFVQEAGHDRSVVKGQWQENVAYDFRWSVTLFVEERDIWLEIFCQQHLPYVKFNKNHWHIRRNTSLTYPAFNGSISPEHLSRLYMMKQEVEGSRIMLENSTHEAVIRGHYKSKVAA